MFFHVPLRGEFRLERIRSARSGSGIRASRFGAVAKDFAQHGVVDEGPNESLAVK
jgi:hypothetical protein